MTVEPWLILLRGINVGGQRPVSMAALREELAGLGYADPVTYINSGNAIVGSRHARTSRRIGTIERALSARFGHEVRIVIRDRAEVAAIVRRLPKGWDPDDASMRYNVMFLVDGADPRAVLRSLPAPKPEVEEARAGPHVLYWSAPVATITRASMLRVASHPAYQQMTIRNLRTTLKLHELLRARG